MMKIPVEFLSMSTKQRRGSLEGQSHGKCSDGSAHHTRTQSLKERLLQRKLPLSKFSFGGSNYDVTKRTKSMGPSHAGSGGLSTVEKADARREDDNPHKADLIISTSSGGKRHKSKRPILQSSSAHHLSALNRESSYENFSVLSGSTPVLSHRVVGVESSKFTTRGDFSPTPVPRNRRARSGSLRIKKGPPPLPPSENPEIDEDKLADENHREAGLFLDTYDKVQTKVQQSGYVIENTLYQADSSLPETHTSLTSLPEAAIKKGPSQPTLSENPEIVNNKFDENLQEEGLFLDIYENVQAKDLGTKVQYSGYVIENTLCRADSSSTETFLSTKNLLGSEQGNHWIVGRAKRRLRDPPKSLALGKKFSSSPCTPYSSLPSTPLSPNNPTFPVSPLYEDAFDSSRFVLPLATHDPETPSLGPVFKTSDSRRASHESQDEGVSFSGPTPTSVVKALAPLLAPAFVVAALKSGMTNKSRKGTNLRGLAGTGKSDSDSGFEIDANVPIILPQDLPQVSQEEFEREYDIVQKIGEGWFSRVYLTEYRKSREEIVLKAINRKSVSSDDFLREFHNSYLLSSHKNVITVHDVVFQVDNYFMFATEYAPLGDLTSNVGENGIGEGAAKRVALQIGSALEWVHSKNLCHLDVKLDNILVFDSDFNVVKLCDFGSVRTQGDIVIKKNELLPYCPAELIAKHANEYYQVDRVQDVFQYGIVVFFCVVGILPWQRADTADPNFAEFLSWRRKRTSKVPKNFKHMSSRGQKLFRKLLDPDPTRRLGLEDICKYTDDKWLKSRSTARSILNLNPVSSSYHGLKHGGKHDSTDPYKFLSDGVSQLTMGSFQSVHSNAMEKNIVLSTLLQHGVETTVDRHQKNNRIINWIFHGQGSDCIDPAEIGCEQEPEADLEESGADATSTDFIRALNN